MKKEKIEVLHLNSSKIGGMGSVAGRLAGVRKIVFTGHGWGFNESRPWIQKKFLYFLHWLSILLSHTTIAVSEKTKRDISGMWFVQNKIHVIHNGIAPIDFLDRGVARQKLAEKSAEPREIVIGTISELHKNKGLDLLIRASKSLPEFVSVFIVGEGEERENLTSQIQSLGLQHTVHLTGRIDDAKKILTGLDIFTLTSRTEALPYTLLEAGQAGLPVLASNVGGIPEIITNEQNGLLVGPKVEEIIKGLQHLLAHPDKRKMFGENLKEKVKKDFSLEQMIEKTIEVYGK